MLLGINRKEEERNRKEKLILKSINHSQISDGNYVTPRRLISYNKYEL